MIAVYIIIFIVSSIVYFVSKSLLLFWRYKHVPGPRPRLPIIGNTFMFYRSNAPTSQFAELAFRDIYNDHKNEGMALVFLGNQEMLYLFKPAFVNDFLKDNTLTYKSDEYRFLKDWLGDGLIVGHGNKWKNDRRMLNPTFHSKVLENFIPSINDECSKFVKEIHDYEKDHFVDVRSIMIDLTLNILAKTAMGISLDNGNKEIEEYRHCLHSIQTLIFRRIFNPLNWNDYLYFKRPVGKLLRQQVNSVHKFTDDVIQKRKVDFKSGEEYGASKQMAFLDQLLTLQHSNESITDKDIREQVDNFMFAGHDTSSVCLSWTLLLLANHSSVQDKLRQEMDSIFGDDRQRDVNMDDINKMTYTDSVIKESLRLFPPAPHVARKATKDFTVNGYDFREGTSVFIAIRYTHRDPEVFKNPDDFIPERFSNGNVFNGAFMPFMTGPRNCIGQRYALIELKIILAHIFRSYKVKCLDKVNDVDITADTIAKPMSPIRVCFEKL